MLTEKYLAHLERIKSREEYREECRIDAIRRDLQTHDLHGPTAVNSEYLDAIPAPSAESLAIFFALLSAEMVKRSRRAKKEADNEQSPHEAYLESIAYAPGWVVHLMKNYDLSREDAISEAARTSDLTPGIIEKALVRAARENLYCRRLEVSRLDKQGLTVQKIAKLMGVDRTTIWRDLDKLRRGEHFTRIGRPSGQPFTS